MSKLIAARLASSWANFVAPMMVEVTPGWVATQLRATCAAGRSNAFATSCAGAVPPYHFPLSTNIDTTISAMKNANIIRKARP